MTPPRGAVEARSAADEAADRDGDVGCGNGCDDPTGALGRGQGDQDDRAGTGPVAQHGAQGAPLRPDQLRLRAGGAAETQAGVLRAAAGDDAGGQRGGLQAGSADADAHLRPASAGGLRRLLRRGAALRRPVGAREARVRFGGRGFRAAELCAGRRLSVRLEPRAGGDRGLTSEGEGSASSALP